MRDLLGLLLLCCTVFPAHAKTGYVHEMPTARIAPAPVGLVFPGFNVAAGVNPAALATMESATAFQAAVTPPLQSGDPFGLFGSIASSIKSFGIGLGVDHYSGGGASSTGLFAGGGVQFRSLSFGFGLRDNDIGSSFSPGIDLGLLIGRQKAGLSGGAVFYDVNHAAQLGVGLGYDMDKKLLVEGNVVFPPFNGSGGGYTLTGSATIYVSDVGLYFRSSYFTAPKTTSHTLGLLAWITRSVNLIFQFTTDRTITLGATFLL